MTETKQKFAVFGKKMSAQEEICALTPMKKDMTKKVH